MNLGLYKTSDSFFIAISAITANNQLKIISIEKKTMLDVANIANLK